MTRTAHVVSAKRVVQVLGGLGLGAAGGFVASLLHRRRPTVYAEGVEQAVPPGHEKDELPQAAERRH